MRKARLIAEQAAEIERLDAEIERLDAEVERWRNAYSVLMESVYLMTLPLDFGSDAAMAQAHTRDQMAALATQYRAYVGASA